MTCDFPVPGGPRTTTQSARSARKITASWLGSLGTTRFNFPPRSMVIDSNHVAYIITLSGLSVVPLTPGGSPAPQIAAKSGIVNPGDGSTTVGLRIDVKCRVLGSSNDPLQGLYAAGLDVNSIWRGKSPAHGCNVGPAMVLGFIAGVSLAEAGG